MTESNEHHVWCNHFMRPQKGCKMCEGLFKDYPYDTSDNPEKIGKDLMKKHFPNVIIRRSDGM